MSDGTGTPATSRFETYKDAFSAYETGKERRYQLLFAVNGGVLAILNISPAAWRDALLGMAMILFTLAMAYDIRMFGERFHAFHPDMFGQAGRTVLENIRLILCVAWLGLILAALAGWAGMDHLGGHRGPVAAPR